MQRCWVCKKRRRRLAPHPQFERGQFGRAGQLVCRRCHRQIEDGLDAEWVEELARFRREHPTLPEP